MIIKEVQKFQRVEVSYVNEQGQIDLISIPAKFENWVKCDENDPQVSENFRNWTGEPVKKVGGYKFQDLNLREFLTKKADPEIQKKIFAYNKPNWFACDIEIDIRNCKGFPEATLAEFPISTIQLTNESLSTVLLIYDDMNRIAGTPEYKNFIAERVRKHFEESKIAKDLIEKYGEGKELKYTHMVFNSEADLLRKFFTLQRELMHHIIGWNWLDFDAPYIHNRSVKVGVNHGMASPTGNLDNREITKDKFQKNTTDWSQQEIEAEKQNRQYKTPQHRVEVDYMQVISKFDFSIDKTSLALDNIAYNVLDVKKVEYGQEDKDGNVIEKGSFLDLFLDTDNFLTYSAIDTVLLMMIHLRVNTITSLEMVTYYAKIPLERGFSTLALGDALFWDEQYTKGLIYCHEDKWADNDDYVDTKFEGGYVIDPRYPTAEWVALIDFKSLYPTCGQSLGCSFDNIIKEEATLEEMKEAIKEGHRVSLNGTIYDKDNIGTLTRVWNRLIFERYHFKDIRVFIDNVLQPVIEKYIKKLDNK